MGAWVPDARLPPEQRYMRRLAPTGWERPVEADHVVVGVAARCGQETDARVVHAAEREDVIVEERIPPLHGEPPTAERHDLGRTRAHATKFGSAPRGASLAPWPKLRARIVHWPTADAGRSPIWKFAESQLHDLV